MESLLRQTTTYDVLREHGIDRRRFVKFCTMMAAALGLEATVVPQIVEALETKPRPPVLWLQGLETMRCTARSQAEEIRQPIMKEYAGQYVLAVEGNAPTADGGVCCTVGGETFLSILQETAENAKAVIAWGSCASNGCVQAAKPNPTGAKPVRHLISHKAIVNVPGCPPIAEVMTGVLT